MNQIRYIFDNYISLFLPYNKKSKKPLVYTSRVKRLIFTEVFVGLILLAFLTLIFICIHWLLSIFVLIFFIIIYPILFLIAVLINSPIEFFIRNYYINDAKKILRKHKNLIKIGITGSYGKTSMKNFLLTILSEKYSCLTTPESYNTPLGITKTIREKLKPTDEIFIVEMGADHKGDIKKLCKIADPDFGIITSIGEQHLLTFKSLENIIKTKFELIDYVSKKGDNRIFLNYEDKNIKTNNKFATFTAYGLSEQKLNLINYIRGVNIKTSVKGISFDVDNNGNVNKKFSANVLGAHNVLNILGAVSIALKLGLSFEEIKRGILKIKQVPHRLEIKKTGNLNIIDDAFNSNPSGFKSALDTLSQFKMCRILITPGMVELGEKEDDLNYEIGKYIFGKADYVFLINKERTKKVYDGLINSKFDKKNIKIFSTLNDAMNHLSKISGEKIVLLENDLPDVYS